MSFLHRLFGGSDAPSAAAPAAPAAPPAPATPAAPAAPTPEGDTATVRRIVGQLEALPRIGHASWPARPTS